MSEIGIIRAASAVACSRVDARFQPRDRGEAELPEEHLAAIEPVRHDERDAAIEEAERCRAARR